VLLLTGVAERFFARCIDKIVGCAICFLTIWLLRPQGAAVNICHKQKSVPWFIMVGLPNDCNQYRKLPPIEEQ